MIYEYSKMKFSDLGKMNKKTKRNIQAFFHTKKTRIT